MDNYTSANLLLINSNSGEKIKYNLSTKEPNLIGRSPDCQVVLNPQEFVTVSRFHAQIKLISQNNNMVWEISDNNTTNGTLINGEKITQPYILRSNDRIMLGLKGPEFIFETEILDSTVIVEINSEDSTILEQVKEEEIEAENDNLDNDNIIEEIELIDDDFLGDKDYKEDKEDKKVIEEEKQEDKSSPVTINKTDIIEDKISVKIKEEKREEKTTPPEIIPTEIVEKKISDTKTEIIDNKPIDTKTEIIENKSSLKTKNKEIKNTEAEILPTQIIDDIANKKQVISSEKKVSIKPQEKEINSSNSIVNKELASHNIWELFNINEIKTIDTEENSFQYLAFNNNHTKIVSSNEKLIKIWSVEEGKEIASFTGHKMAVNTANFSHDNQLIVSGGADKLVKIWSVEEGKEIASLSGHKMAINTANFSNDNQLIVSGGADKLVKIWSVEEGKEIASLSGHKMAVNTAIFSHDNQLIISSGGDKLIKVWNVATQEEEKSIKTEFKSPITDLILHPHKLAVLCVSQQDEKMALIDLETELELFSFRIPNDYSSLTKMNVDGSHFVSLVNGKNLVIWQYNFCDFTS